MKKAKVFLKGHSLSILFKEVYPKGHLYRDSLHLLLTKKGFETSQYLIVLWSYLRIAFRSFSCNELPSDLIRHLYLDVVLMEIFTGGSGYNFVTSQMTSVDVRLLKRFTEKIFVDSSFESKEAVCRFLGSLYEFNMC